MVAQPANREGIPDSEVQDSEIRGYVASTQEVGNTVESIPGNLLIDSVELKIVDAFGPPVLELTVNLADGSSLGSYVELPIPPGGGVTE